MYSIRRQYIPPAPTIQVELDTTLDWFKVSLGSDESMVKGDIIHIDGLRVLLFSTDESLKIMSRSRIILADGTFLICPYLWYQVFILNAEFSPSLFWSFTGQEKVSNRFLLFIPLNCFLLGGHIKISTHLSRMLSLTHLGSWSSVQSS